jgi:hypothetical protein
VTLNTDGTVANLVLGGSSSGTQTLLAHGFRFTLRAGNTYINNGGVVSLNNEGLNGAVTVANGGLLSCDTTEVAAPVTVQSGGQLRLQGEVFMYDWVWVQSGGELDASNALMDVYAPMTNAGLANFTNYGINLTLYSGLWNQRGAVLNLISTAGIESDPYFPYSYVVNHGTINVANGNSTISANVTNLGIVATMPGTGALRIGYFNGIGSLTGTYIAAAGTLIQFMCISGSGTSPGTPLVLGGEGHHQFVSGSLILPTDVIPGLALMGGMLQLGPGFQGGAITNLALYGTSLTNNLPILGTLVMSNGVLATIDTLTNAGVLSLNGASMYGQLNVTAGGFLSCSNSTVGAQVTVQGGGKLLLMGSTSFVKDPAVPNTNDWLWVQNGGELDAASMAHLYLYTAMTNEGLANFTNSGITIYNNGTSGYSGRLWNLPGGVLNLISAAGIAGRGYGPEYMVNQGTLNCLSSNATSHIYVNNFTNAASLNALYGTLRLQIGHLGNLVLQPSGTLSVGLSSATVYGVIDIPGTNLLAGAFGAILNDGFVPQLGASFNVVTYGSFTGAFNNTNFQSIAPAPAFPGLQHTVSFGTTYSSTFMTITAQQITEQFVFVGNNGPPGHEYVVLGSTNLALPRAAWTPLATNYFDANGSFVFTTNVDLATRQQFFTYRYQ